MQGVHAGSSTCSLSWGLPRTTGKTRVCRPAGGTTAQFTDANDEGLNFSREGLPWRLTVVTDDMVAKEHVPPLPGVGLLFTADDGSRRFLRYDSNALPCIEELQTKSNQELGSLAQRAATWLAEQRS